MWDVVGVGRAVVDYTVLVKKYPQVDEKTVALDRYYGSGSPVPNACAALGKWGHRVALCAKVGGDTDGTYFVEDVQKQNVDTSNVRISTEYTTPRAHIWVEKKSGRRTIVLDRNIAPLSIDELPLEALENTKYLHLDGVEADAAVRAAEVVRNSGGKVMLDAGNVRERMDEQLKLADYIVVPVAFVRSYFGSIDLFEAVRDLKSRGAELAIVTNGAGGAIACGSDGEPVWYRSYPLKAVDTTGAGDIFHAAFLHGLLRDYSVPDTIRWASAAAGLSITKLGGRGFVPSKNEVIEFLQSVGEEFQD